MSTTLKWIIGIVVVAILGVATGAMFFGSHASTSYGAINNGAEVQNFPFWFTNGVYAGASQQWAVSATGAETDNGGLTVGASGTAINSIATGQCLIKPYATTVAASSSATVDCAAGTLTGLTPLSGVAFGYNTIVSLSTTTATTVVGGLDLVGASASTTPGYITLQVFNQTGTTYTWSTSLPASGTASYIVTH